MNREYISLEHYIVQLDSDQCILHHKLVDRPLNSQYQGGKLLVLIGGNAGRDDWAGHAASSAQSSLRGNENVRNVLRNGKSEGNHKNRTLHTFSSHNRGR